VDHRHHLGTEGTEMRLFNKLKNNQLNKYKSNALFNDANIFKFIIT